MKAAQTLTIRRAADRGQADFGWLKSAHTFSFGQYHDPNHMQFGMLRVINDDEVAGGGGTDLSRPRHHTQSVVASRQRQDTYQ